MYVYKVYENTLQRFKSSTRILNLKLLNKYKIMNKYTTFIHRSTQLEKLCIFSFQKQIFVGSRKINKNRKKVTAPQTCCTNIQQFVHLVIFFKLEMPV